VGNWFPCFFCLPIIALGIVIVHVLCAIKYFLDYFLVLLFVLIRMVIIRMDGERRGKAKKVKKKGKTNK
jgi:hypothetical protein